MNDGASVPDPALVSDQAAKRLAPPGFDPSRLSHYEQMLDAQKGCVPCKLCGGSAVITDAGLGAGYYIECGNSRSFRPSYGCLIDERRLSGWAYNVRDWWNRLHATVPARDSDASLAEDPQGLSGEAVAARAEGIAPPAPPIHQQDRSDDN